MRSGRDGKETSGIDREREREKKKKARQRDVVERNVEWKRWKEREKGRIEEWGNGREGRETRGIV